MKGVKEQEGVDYRDGDRNGDGETVRGRKLEKKRETAVGVGMGGGVLVTAQRQDRKELWGELSGDIGGTRATGV